MRARPQQSQRQRCVPDDKSYGFRIVILIKITIPVIVREMVWPDPHEDIHGRSADRQTGNGLLGGRRGVGAVIQSCRPIRPLLEGECAVQEHMVIDHQGKSALGSQNLGGVI